MISFFRMAFTGSMATIHRTINLLKRMILQLSAKWD